MPPIRILHVIPTLSSGGAERQLASLVCHPGTPSLEHIVCVIGGPDFFSSQIKEAGVEVRELGISRKHPFLETARRLRAIVRETKPDIIHSRLYDANISSRLATLPGRSIPIITSLELSDYEPQVIALGGWNPNKVRVLKAIDKLTASLTHPHFVPCSNFVKNSYQRNYGIAERDVTVINNGVDSDAMPGAADITDFRRELGLPDDAFVYLHVGRLDAQKNHRLIFEAFAEISKRNPNFFLLLAGTGLLESELTNQIDALGLNRQVLFLGRRDDVGALLELADIFVLPSFFEGHPVALVEAMFKSLPCIASRIEVFEDVLEDRVTGILIDPTSPEELAAAMNELYQNPQLRKLLGENAFRLASEKYTLAQTAKSWETLYHQILDRKNA